jgi:hypothetical protein
MAVRGCRTRCYGRGWLRLLVVRRASRHRCWPAQREGMAGPVPLILLISDYQ